jgi:DNA-binding PadR family transcriptional regulator
VIDLDYCVAGVVWRDGPVSAYRVRERFRASMTPAWSSSCGTIYPVIRRLLAEELITATDPINRRGTQLLEITAGGKEAVTEWILRIAPATAAPVPDPIRTRLQYLSVLPEDVANRFMADAISATQQSLDLLLDSLPRRAEADQIDFLAALGSVHQLKGRLRWLKAIRPAMRDQSGEILHRLLTGAQHEEQ